MANRSDWVNTAKGIGIVLVVYGHVARSLMSAGLASTTGSIALVDSVIYTFHMPLFFFLSGLFFEHGYNRRHASGLMWSKVDTIVYPYLLWSLAQGSIQAALSSYTNDPQGFGRLSRILWSPISPFWFLHALFAIFAVATLVRRWLPERRLAALFGGAVIAYLVTARTGAPEQVLFVTDNLVFFAVGMLATQRGAVARTATPSWTLVAGLLAATAIGQFVFHAVLDARFDDRGAAALGLAFLSIGAVVAVSRRLAFSSPLLLTLGGASMGVYVMHILAGSGTRIALSSILEVDSLPIHLIIGCLAGVFGPLAVLKLADRFGIRYLLQAPISTRLRRSEAQPPVLVES